MINPYNNIAWNSVNRIQSCSHEHCENQTQFNRLVESSGIRHIAISNYYPSAPVYPLSEKFTYGIPVDAISCPNAEQHVLSIDGMHHNYLHINSLGSFFESGSPRGETPAGCEWEDVLTVIDKITSELQFSDGGGVTINHPVWSGLTFEQVCLMLDHDPRVLGIEFFNETSEKDNGTGWALRLWDEILQTGRKCYGFAVADHEGQGTADWKGRNILLVNTIDEHSCLQAYRIGAFYGQINHTSLTFDEVSLSGSTFTVTASEADKIIIVIDGESTEYQNTSVSVSIPDSATYIRAEAHTADDSIYANPIILKEYVPKRHNTTKNILLFMS